MDNLADAGVAPYLCAYCCHHGLEDGVICARCETRVHEMCARNQDDGSWLCTTCAEKAGDD